MRLLVILIKINKNEQRIMKGIGIVFLVFGFVLLVVGVVIDVIDNNKNK